MKETDYIFTVGIPFFNNSEHLCKAIGSVLNQTYSNFELILTDDGSSDGSIEIARKFSDQRIIILSDGKNLGLPTRLNEQINLARGKYFVRMDADDIMHPRRLECQFEVLSDNPKVDVVGSSAFLIDHNDDIIGIMNCNKQPSTLSDVFYHNCFIHPTVTGKVDWFSRNLYNPIKLKAQDFDLWYKTINSSYFLNIDKPLMFYRIDRNTNISNYLLVQRYVRDTLSSYKNNKKHKFIFINYLKTIIYILISMMRIGKIFNKTKHSNLSKKCLAEAQLCLNESKHK